MTDPLQLAELLDFRPDEGIIRLHEQRVVILSAAAMGLLRKELIDTLGTETARRLLMRFRLRRRLPRRRQPARSSPPGPDPLDGLRTGAVVHTLEGIVRADLTSVEFDAETGRFEARSEWHDSYEAEQHVHHYGTSAQPVCWSLIGYASGYASACFEREIYFRESSCLGEGKKSCTVVGRDAASWGDASRSPAPRLPEQGSRAARWSGCGRPSSGDAGAGSARARARKRASGN